MVHYAVGFVPQTVSLRIATRNLTVCGTTEASIATMTVTMLNEPTSLKSVANYFDDFRSPQVVANLPFGSTAKNAEFSPR